MKPFALTTSRSPIDWIDNLDDAMLRSGHGLLDDSRVRDFDTWMDFQLQRLECQFRSFTSRRSLRAALGR